MCLLGIAAVAHVLDEVHAAPGYRDERFTRPFQGKVWGTHYEARIGLTLAVNVGCGQSHKGLTTAAFCNYFRGVIFLEEVAETLNRQCLCGQWLAQNMFHARGKRVRGSLQRREGGKNLLTKNSGVLAHVVIDRSHGGPLRQSGS